MQISNKVYDALKWVTLIVIPATGTAYLGLSQIWPLQYGQEVMSTAVVLNLFLGTLLGISTAQRNASGNNVDGYLNAVKSPDGTSYSLEFKDYLENLADQKQIVLTPQYVDAPVEDIVDGGEH